MQILDGKNHRRGGWDKIGLDIILEYLNTGRYWGWLSFPPTSTNYTAEELRRADEVFLMTFRGLVDQWIASGIKDDGVEMPSQRYVRPAPSGYPESLFDILLGWLNRHTPRPALLNNGTIGILDRTPEPYGVELETYARETAIYRLKELLECPTPYRLGKCKNPKCETPYFVRRRARNGVIKRGTYCGGCELIGAAERTRLSRQRRKNQMLDAAAKTWPQWTKTNRYPNQAQWIAQRVNREIAGPRIKAKWVNQNREQILKRVSRSAV